MSAPRDFTFMRVDEHKRHVETITRRAPTWFLARAIAAQDRGCDPDMLRPMPRRMMRAG